MGIIHVLDKHVAELIAAGEVVERPSSVIKELFENAVDAGATVIDVSIEHGGVTRMSITDNGRGISREDIRTAFLRHATSKVSTQEDLEKIHTLGFRGEALASIAAVSRVSVVTCALEEEIGTHYVIEGGEEQLCEDVGCEKGTTFTVENLFYNVPARMKFLKTDMGEGNAVSGILEKLALSHPEIAVHFHRDGKEVISTSGDGNLDSCIYSVLGKDFFKTLMPIEYSLNNVSVRGFINKIESGRANRSMQFFFINGRFVKTRTGAAALEQAYKGSLMVGQFPTCVLFIDVPNEFVDVNVHPAKIEVRFVNEKPVFDVIYHGCKTAINGQTTRKEGLFSFEKKKPTSEQLYMAFETPETNKEDDNEKTSVKVPFVSRITGVGTSIETSDVLDVNPLKIKDFSVDEPKKIDINIEYDELPSMVTTVSPKESTVRFIGELLSTYVLAEMNDALYLIDKHAAHERMLYNQLIQSKHTESQQLLEPVSVTLTSEECNILLENKEMLLQAGFEVESFGNREVLIRAVPILLSSEDVQELIQEIAGNFLSGKKEVSVNHLDWLYHTTACRAAVKAGNTSQLADLQYLAEYVLQHEEIRTCPHGRPVCISITKKEIEKQFGRIV